MEIIGIVRWTEGCRIIEYKRIVEKTMSGSRDEMEGETRGLGRERKRSRREQARKAETESEREKRELVESQIAFGQGWVVEAGKERTSSQRTSYAGTSEAS